jgi:hypothetical protein
MAEFEFAQTRSRSLLGPGLGAFLLLLVAGGLLLHFSAPGEVTLKAGPTSVLETRTLFKSDTIVVGPEHTETVLFVATPVHIENLRTAPITLEGAGLTFTNADGAHLTAKALSASELASVRQSFPALVPITAGDPLRGDAVIAPKRGLDGLVVFSLQIPKAMWDARRMAQLHLDLYELPPLSITLPKPGAQ